MLFPVVSTISYAGPFLVVICTWRIILMQTGEKGTPVEYPNEAGTVRWCESWM